jgi:hypothetical protein
MLIDGSIYVYLVLINLPVKIVLYIVILRI